MEVTIEEAQTHLAFETQHQWNDWTIGRRTPALLGLYSLFTLMAHAPPAVRFPVLSVLRGQEAGGRCVFH